MNEAVKVLELALESANNSMCDFEMYLDFNTDGDMETANSFWSSCRFYDGMAVAYLKAYEVLTGTKVENVPCDIEAELVAVA